jgi:hypothetical protein
MSPEHQPQMDFFISFDSYVAPPFGRFLSVMKLTSGKSLLSSHIKGLRNGTLSQFRHGSARVNNSILILVWGKNKNNSPANCFCMQELHNNQKTPAGAVFYYANRKHSFPKGGKSRCAQRTSRGSHPEPETV